MTCRMKRPFNREKLLEMSHTPKDPEKAVRRAEALRANLKRRKAAARKAKDEPPVPEVGKRE
jgi:hypothetical protein